MDSNEEREADGERQVERETRGQRETGGERERGGWEHVDDLRSHQGEAAVGER